MKDRIFDKLSFPMLIAGELELAAQACGEEAKARIGIAKTMCYHKLYLSDEDLRVGYDSTLKSVEQGEETWSPALVDNLNRHYEFRVTAVLREKLQASETLNNKAKNSPPTKDSQEESDEGGSEKVVYCMDYNKGTCTHSKSHVGKFRGKQVTKWHVCRVCLKDKELKCHPEKECKSKQA